MKGLPTYSKLLIYEPIFRVFIKLLLRIHINAIGKEIRCDLSNKMEEDMEFDRNANKKSPS